MQLRYVFTELGSGLRRNLSMHLAVILTLFVSLSLVGVGVLLNQEAHRVADRWGSQLQITVYLCSRQDTNPACTGAVTPTQKQAIQKVVDTNTQVSSSHQESQQDAFNKLKEQFPGKYDGPNSPITAADITPDRNHLSISGQSKQAAVDLKARRDQLSTKLGTMQDRAAADWDAFTKDVNDSFDKIESDTNDALK